MADPSEAVRLDVRLVSDGAARSRQRATEAIRSGRVQVDGRVVRKPAFAVDAGAFVEVEPDPQTPYVSRGALKLLGALDELDVVVPAARCIDAGASTGGFTQVLLERGATSVVAIDVGTDQLAVALRDDPRVVDLQQTHLADVDVEEIGGPGALVVADLSFISLTAVLPALERLTTPDGRLLLMVKPQFEVGRRRLGSGGVVRDPIQRRDAVLAVATAAAGLGLHAHAIAPSRVPGPAGNVEYFLLLSRSPAPRTARDHWDDIVLRS